MAGCQRAQVWYSSRHRFYHHIVDIFDKTRNLRSNIDETLDRSCNRKVRNNHRNLDSDDHFYTSALETFFPSLILEGSVDQLWMEGKIL